MKHERIIRKNLLIRLLSFAFVALFLITVLPSFAEGSVFKDGQRGHTLSGQRAIEWLVRNHYIDPYTHRPTKRFYDFHKALHTAPRPGPGGLGLIISDEYEGWHPYQEPTNRPIKNVTIVVEDSRDAFNIAGMWKSNYVVDGRHVCYYIEQGPHSNSFNWKIIHHLIPEEWVIVPITYYDYISCQYNRPFGPDATGDIWKPIRGTIEIPRRGNLAEKINWGGIIWERDYAKYCYMAGKNVKGRWTAVNYSPNGTPVHYIINQVNDLISWTIQHPDIPQERTRNCKISGNRISCEFNRPVGPDSNGMNGWTLINGTINERSNQIRWDNGIVWSR